MLDPFPVNSVGLVAPQSLVIDTEISLESGKKLQSYEIAYETYGQLNADKSNAILVCHALSGHQHAAGYHTREDKKAGWWETCIGPDKPIDTNHFFVVCPNNIGGCHGSSGPSSINPKNNRLYGPDFPVVTVKDWVKSQAQISDALGIDQWLAVVGGSLGGMQALQWAIDYPDRLKYSVALAAAPKLSAQNIAFNEVARQAIMSDPDFFDGHYAEHDKTPRQGLMLARMLGHITYLSDDMMRDKFGRELREGKLNFGFDVDFQVESYLRYQGRSFVDKFDANTYLLMTKALDYFDPAAEYSDSLISTFQQARAKFFIASFSSDWRFPPERSREIANALLYAGKEVTYAEFEVAEGHDAFLLPIEKYLNTFQAYMKRIASETELV